MPEPGLPLALVTVPLTVSVPFGVAGLGETVSTIVARAALTVIVVGVDVLGPRPELAAGAKVEVTI